MGVLVALVAALVLAWPVGLLIWANGKIQHVDALSGAAGFLLGRRRRRGPAAVLADDLQAALARLLS